MILLAVASKGFQFFVNRSTSWVDIVLNLQGIAVDWGLWRLFYLYQSKTESFRQIQYPLIFVVVCLATAHAIYPLLCAGRIWYHQTTEFPAIMNPTLPSFLSMTESISDFDEVTINVSRDELVIDIHHGSVPGTVIGHFLSDWRNYQHLVVTFHNPMNEPMGLNFGVRDGHSDPHPDYSFARDFLLEEHERREVELDLGDIVNGSRLHEIDLSDLQVLVIYRSDATGGQFRLGEIKLR